MIPLIPIAIYETKASGSRIMSALASMFTWSLSIITYYLIVPIKLVLLGQASRQELYIGNYRDAFYWHNLKSLLYNDVLKSILEWIGVSIIGGGIIGFTVSCIYLRYRNPHKH